MATQTDGYFKLFFLCLTMVTWVVLLPNAVRSSRPCRQKCSCWRRLCHENRGLWLGTECQRPGVLQKDNRCEQVLLQLRAIFNWVLSNFAFALLYLYHTLWLYWQKNFRHFPKHTRNKNQSRACFPLYLHVGCFSFSDFDLWLTRSHDRNAEFHVRSSMYHDFALFRDVLWENPMRFFNNIAWIKQAVSTQLFVWPLDKIYFSFLHTLASFGATP